MTDKIKKEKRLMTKGVSRRWLLNTMGIVMLVLVVFIISILLMAQNYAYSSVNSVLRGRVDELLNVLSYQSGGYKTTAEFTTKVRDYVEGFPDKNRMEIMAINRAGRVFVTCTGFAPEADQQMPDYEDALYSEDNMGYWVGPLDTNEKVMAITRVVRDEDDNILGSIRYVVSMEKIDQQMWIITASMVLIGGIIMLIVVASGIYFIRSIIVPVKKLTSSAQQIALGEFDVRIEKSKDDEIGLLVDSINDMASELGKTEIMKNDFISSVSHELRTPLTSIKGWAETLQFESDPDTREKGMNVIIRESQRLSGIVEELLDFSKLQSGRMRINIHPIDMLSVLDEAVYMFTDRAVTEEKELVYEESLILPKVYADADRIKQVFVNVIDNALKYTEKGGLIRISAEERQGYVNITVSDNGCGILPEHLLDVKKKFYKANKHVRGSGIGLAVADEIVYLHAGKLEIESRESTGTTVKISFPTMSYVDSHPNMPLSDELRAFLSQTI